MDPPRESATEQDLILVQFLIYVFILEYFWLQLSKLLWCHIKDKKFYY